MSLCNLEINHKYGVFEIGMNKPGEIEKLSKIVKPKISVITNIAEAHIENFKNLFGIAKEKSQIISNTEKNGTVILNRDDKFFSFLNEKAKKRNLKVVCFGKHKSSDVRILNLQKIKKYEYCKNKSNR